MLRGLRRRVSSRNMKKGKKAPPASPGRQETIEAEVAPLAPPEAAPHGMPPSSPQQQSHPNGGYHGHFDQQQQQQQPQMQHMQQQQQQQHHMQQQPHMQQQQPQPHMQQNPPQHHMMQPHLQQPHHMQQQPQQPQEEYEQRDDVRKPRGSSNGKQRNGSTTTVATTGTATTALTSASAGTISSAMTMTTTVGDLVRWWATSFRRTDPRFKILHFFNDVSQQEARNDPAQLAKDNGLHSTAFFHGSSNHAGHGGLLSSSGGSNAFANLVLTQHAATKKTNSNASCFSVWRPTSRDALRYMMLGQAVGKGLDIKGKSAKCGVLSAFVPFLQIHNDDHIHKIRVKKPQQGGSRIRIFFATQRHQLAVCQTLEEEVQAQLQLNNQQQNQSSAWQIEVLDNYAPACYGLSVPEFILWQVLIVQAPSVSRDSSPEAQRFATGRPSVPQFQDMNLEAIRKNSALPEKATPHRIVLWQWDPEDPWNPLSLLMSYEERGHHRVLPVVSDLDCFLIGTRGVNYEQPLPEDQIKVLEWSIDQMEGILSSQEEEQRQSQMQQQPQSWTSQWLDVLKTSAKDHGFHPKIPPLGFADPKTSMIMKHAINRLSETGAVRHGAESFNFYFPQDLDEEFLVISDYLPGQELSWTYVDTYGLLGILSEKLDNGYTFPLNPKWVLCDDPGWKILWDKLMVSNEAESSGSLDAWFPKKTGIRERVNKICQSFPQGFLTPQQWQEDMAEMNGGAAVAAAPAPVNDDDAILGDDMDAEMAMELANYELIQYLMDLDQQEKERERERRNAASSSASAARPGAFSASSEDDSAASAKARPGAFSASGGPQHGKRPVLGGAASAAAAPAPAAARPGAYSSRVDVARMKQNYRHDSSRTLSSVEEQQQPAKPDSKQDPIVANFSNMLESMKSMGVAEVLVDILASGMKEHEQHEPMQIYCLEQLCQMLEQEQEKQKNRDIQDFILARGMEVDTIMTMKQFESSLVVQEQSCKLLWLLSKGDDDATQQAHVRLGNRICVVATSRLMNVLKLATDDQKKDSGKDDKVDRIKLTRYAIGALDKLILDNEAGGVFKGLGGQATVIQALEQNTERSAIQMDGISVLLTSSLLEGGAVEGEESNSDKILACAIQALIHHFKTCQSPGKSTASVAIQVLSRWTTSKPEEKDHVLSILDKHQQELMEPLQFVTKESADASCRDGASDVFQLVKPPEKKAAPVAASSVRDNPTATVVAQALHDLREGKHSADVTATAMDRLIDLLNQAAGEANDAMLRENGIPAICDSMKLFDQLATIQNKGCALIQMMAKLSPMQVLASGVACNALLHAIWCHKNVNSLQRLALSALVGLSSSTDCRDQIERNGHMQFLQELIYYTEDAEAAELGILVLTNFSSMM